MKTGWEIKIIETQSDEIWEGKIVKHNSKMKKN